jgi:hypothetical protein
VYIEKAAKELGRGEAIDQEKIVVSVQHRIDANSNRVEFLIMQPGLERDCEARAIINRLEMKFSVPVCTFPVRSLTNKIYVVYMRLNKYAMVIMGDSAPKCQVTSAARFLPWNLFS